MSRAADIAMHGQLVVRIVDRMTQMRVDCAKAFLDGKIEFDDRSDGLSRFDEATAIVAIVRAAKLTELPLTYDMDRSDDIGAYFRLYALKSGHVMTDQDIVDLEAVLAELNDEIGDQAEKHHLARLSAFREIGGEELVKAVEAKDQAFIDASVEKALAKYREGAAS